MVTNAATEPTAENLRESAKSVDKSFRFSLPVATLRAALPTLRLVASARSKLPILGCLHIEHRDGQTRLSATDLDRRLTFTTGTPEPVPASDLGRKLLEARRARENGAICVPLKTLQAVAKAADRTGDLLFTEQSFTYPFDLKPIKVKDYLGAEEFPPLQHPSGEWQPMSDAARDAMIEAIPSASTDETRYILLSVLLEKLASDRIAAANGRCLFICHTPLPDCIGAGWVVPTSALTALAGAPAKHPWQIAAGEPNKDKVLVSAFFRGGPWEMHTKLIEGNYPNIDQVTPPEDKKHVVLRLTMAQRNEILSLLKRQPPSTTDNTDSVLVTVQNGLLHFKGHDGWSFQVRLDKDHGKRFIKGAREYWVRAFTLCHEIRILDEMSPVLARNTIGPAKTIFVFMPVRTT